MTRTCTCHPDDNRPQPCAERYALTECLALERLAAFIVDDLLNMTDEEILAEVTADGEDPRQIAQETKDIFERVVATTLDTHETQGDF